MKSLFSLVTCTILAFTSALVFTPEAEAGSQPSTALNGGTNNVGSNGATGVTSNYVAGTSVACAFASHVGFMFQYSCSVAATSNVVFGIDASLDNVNWYTNYLTIPVAAKGTAPAIGVTNLLTGGIPFFRLGSIVNTNSTYLTNIVFQGFTKTGL